MARGGQRGQHARDAARRIQDNAAATVDVMMNVQIKPLGHKSTKKQGEEADKAMERAKKIFYAKQ
tara:strand:+ start:1390 stop:1584 length:195 start_codon:yes stop_codon:yes gene_type:complete